MDDNLVVVKICSYVYGNERKDARHTHTSKTLLGRDNDSGGNGGCLEVWCSFGGGEMAYGLKRMIMDYVTAVWYC